MTERNISQVPILGVANDSPLVDDGTELSIQAVKLEINARTVLGDFIIDLALGDVISSAKQHIPEKLNRVSEYLEFPLAGPMPLSAFQEIDARSIMDSLGVDFLVEIQGKRYAIDVSTTKRYGIEQKTKKLFKMKSFLTAIGDFEPLIIRSIDGELPLDLLSRLEKGTRVVNGVDVLYIPAEERLPRKRRH